MLIRGGARGPATKADLLHSSALLTQRLYLLLLFLLFYCAPSHARTRAYSQHPQLAQDPMLTTYTMNEAEGTEGNKDGMTPTQLHSWQADPSLAWEANTVLLNSRLPNNDSNVSFHLLKTHRRPYYTYIISLNSLNLGSFS